MVLGLTALSTTVNTRYHGVELGQVSCGKQTFGCGI